MQKPACFRCASIGERQTILAPLHYAYERAFVRLGDVTDVHEFGVLEGRSIEWLAKRFPTARIVGVDIAAPKPTWPRSDCIH
jgi:hypothetical protein